MAEPLHTADACRSCHSRCLIAIRFLLLFGVMIVVVLCGFCSRLVLLCQGDGDMSGFAEVGGRFQLSDLAVGLPENSSQGDDPVIIAVPNAVCNKHR
ncbi:hypothetical protein BDV06DRAFT_200734 [Aspergillus oleicola]